MFTSVVDSIIGLDSSSLCHITFHSSTGGIYFLPLHFELSHVTSLVNRMLENITQGRASNILGHLNIPSGTSTAPLEKQATANPMVQEG